MSQNLIARLKLIAEQARHHPEPAVMVALLAQLLLDLATELEAKAPIFMKFFTLLGTDASAFEAAIAKVQAEIDAAQAATDADAAGWPAVAEGSGEQTAA